MAALHPAVAAVRAAVRHYLRTSLPRFCQAEGLNLDEPPLALVACSGGADSLALAAAAAFVAPRSGWQAGLVTVDHQLQPGSGERAQAVVTWGRAQGFDPGVAVPVRVAGRRGGVEAAAREARYEALRQVARESGAAVVLLGHTRDDQAETVLLALLRGGGPRGLAGMPETRYLRPAGRNAERANGALEDGGPDPLLGRPLLGLSRAQTRAACAALGIEVWDDPHNRDPAYARTRARMIMAYLNETLGPATAANLAQTARLIAADNEALDGWAKREFARLGGPSAGIGSAGLNCAELARLLEAVRTRVLHTWALTLGCPGTDLSHRHIAALDALVTEWRGQGAVHLPGGVQIRRREGHLVAE